MSFKWFNCFLRQLSRNYKKLIGQQKERQLTIILKTDIFIQCFVKQVAPLVTSFLFGWNPNTKWVALFWISEIKKCCLLVPSASHFHPTHSRQAFQTGQLLSSPSELILIRIQRPSRFKDCFLKCPFFQNKSIF